MGVVPIALRRPETLTAAIARSIGEALVRGGFASGRALPELPLASQVGASRGTVREALRLLAGQGLVTIVQHHGAFVAELTPRTAREIFTLRAELDMRFHDLLVRECGHETLLDLLASLRDQMRRTIVCAKLVDSDVEPEAVTHRRLRDAVRDGDGERAAGEVHKHILVAGELMLQRMAATEVDAASEDRASRQTGR